MINLYFHKITDTHDIIYRVESLSGIMIEPQYYKTSSYTIDGETVYPLNEIDNDNDFIRNFCDVYQNDFDDAFLENIVFIFFKNEKFYLGICPKQYGDYREFIFSLEKDDFPLLSSYIQHGEILLLPFKEKESDDKNDNYKPIMGISVNISIFYSLFQHIYTFDLSTGSVNLRLLSYIQLYESPTIENLERYYLYSIEQLNSKLKCFYVSNVQLESMESFLENSWHIQNFWIRGDIQ